MKSTARTVIFKPMPSCKSGVIILLCDSMLDTFCQVTVVVSPSKIISYDTSKATIPRVGKDVCHALTKRN